MKHIRELIRFLERRHKVKVCLSSDRVAGHPVIYCRAKGKLVCIKASSSPSDSQRDAVNTERTMKRAFRVLGVELERKS